MLNLSDEAMSVVVDNVPRKGTAQLRSAERVDGAPRYFTLQLIDQTEQVRARADRDRALGLGGPEPAPTS